MKRYLLILNIILAATSVYLGVNTVNTFVSPEKNPPASYQNGAKTAPKGTEKTKPFSDYKTINKHNLFSRKPAGPVKEKPLEIETLKKTDLKLKLWGTVIGNDGETYAVVESNDRTQHLFRAGDSIQGAIIKLILRGKVVLTVNGKDEVLEMEKMLTSSAGRSYPAASKSIPQQKIPVERSQIESAVQNVNQMMQEIKIRPHFEQGKLDGVSIIGIKPNSIFRKMGLLSGDILTGIDGNKVESVEDVMQFLENLDSATMAKLDIKRKGRTQTIEYNIE